MLLKKYLLTLLGIVLIELGASLPAQAVPLYEVGLRNNVFLSGTPTSSAIPPHTDMFTTTFNHTNASATLTADQGVLTNQHTHNLEFQSLAFGINGSATSSSIFEYNDLIFFDVSNPVATGDIQVSATAHFSGTMDENWFAEGVGGTERIIGASYAVRIQIGSEVFNHSFPVDVEGNFAGSFTTPLVTVPLNVPTNFFGRSQFLTGTLMNPDNNSGGFVSLASVTQFSQSPIFDIPSGFSVNSIDGGIINNQFGAEIPEPPPLALAALGLLALGHRRRRA